MTPDDDWRQIAITLIRALGLTKTDLLGFSLGGFIAQVIAQKHPDLVRRMILAGTSAAGGEEVNNVNAVLQNMVANATAEKKHPKQSLFFTQSHDGQKAAAEFLQRLGIRQLDRDVAHPNSIKKSLDKEPALGTVRILFAAGMRKWKIPF